MGNTVWFEFKVSSTNVFLRVTGMTGFQSHKRIGQRPKNLRLLSVTEKVSLYHYFFISPKNKPYYARL